MELFGTRELIDELMRRTTFQGVIIHSLEEAKWREWDGERTFCVRTNENFSPEEAGRLLDVVSQYLANHE